MSLTFQSSIGILLCCIILFCNCAGISIESPDSEILENVARQQSFKEKVEGLPSYKETVRGGRSQSRHDPSTCKLRPELVAEIAGYKDVADKIMDEVLQKSFKGRTHKNLGNFVDEFGARVSGSDVLENSLDHMIERMKGYGFDKVWGEEVVVPHFRRGQETATLLTPRKKNIAILGLVPSVGTKPEGITAPVYVVRDFEELKANPEKAKGKIIVYNQDWVSYGVSVSYRSRGASEAAKAGGVASLIRSIAPFSLDTPHTGGQSYESNVTRIPTACITVEDAQMMARMQDEGQNMTIHLSMLSYVLPPRTSRNVIGELTGTEKPHEIVGVSGHIDSWDVGQGAMDDAGGVFVSVEALALLKQLNLQPRRSLQAILWTSEEVGLVGVADYVRRHKADNTLKNFSAIFESDYGTFRPRGLEFAGTEEAGCIVYEVLKHLGPIDAANYTKLDSVGSDISHLIREGVPGLSLDHVSDHYFWYHHTEADTMTVQDPEEMDLCTAVWAVTSYVIANLTDPLPRAPAPAPGTRQAELPITVC